MWDIVLNHLVKSYPALGEKVVRVQDKMSQLGRTHGQKIVDVKDAVTETVTKYTALTLESGKTAYQMAKGPAKKISVAVVKVKEVVSNMIQVLLRMWREWSRKTEAITAAPEVVPEPAVKAEEPAVPEVKAEEPKVPEVKAEEPAVPEVKAEELKVLVAKVEDRKVRKVRKLVSKIEERKVPEVKVQVSLAPVTKIEKPKVVLTKAEEPKVAKVKVEVSKVPVIKYVEPKTFEQKVPEVPELKMEEQKVPEVPELKVEEQIVEETKALETVQSSLFSSPKSDKPFSPYYPPRVARIPKKVESVVEPKPGN